MLFSTSKGRTLRGIDVRSMGRRYPRRARSMHLAGRRVISMVVAEGRARSVLTATENGFGKAHRHAANTRRHSPRRAGHHRHQTSSRGNGKVVAAVLVRRGRDHDDHHGGVLIHTKVNQIREMGRPPRRHAD